MGKTLVVVEELAGRPFLVTTKNNGRVIQKQFTLHAGLKDSEIRNLVQNHVPVECFEANSALGIAEAKKAMEDLKRFAIGATDKMKRLSPTVRTTLVDFGSPRKIAPAAPAGNPKAEAAMIELQLIKAGVDFETAAAVAGASLEALKEMDYKEIGKKLGLTGNFGLQRVYDKMRE